MVRREGHRAIATERIYGPGRTPGSRVLLAAVGRRIPEGTVIDTPPATAADEVPDTVAALASWLDAADSIEQLTARVAAARDVEDVRARGPRPSVVELLDHAGEVIREETGG